MRKFKCITGNGRDFTTGLIYTLEENGCVDTNKGSVIKPLGYPNGFEWLAHESHMQFEELPEE